MIDIDTKTLLAAYRAAREATNLPGVDDTLFVWIMATVYKVFAQRGGELTDDFTKTVTETLRESARTELAARRITGTTTVPPAPARRGSTTR